MEAFGRYLLQIVAVAILCGILGSLCEKSSNMPVIRLILGTVMVISVLQPVLKLSIQDITMDYHEMAIMGNGYVTEGQDQAKAAAAVIISDRINAYIENKAAQLGAEVSASIYMKDGIPESVTIAGDIPPYVRSQLSAWIASEIGIVKEEQRWN